MVAGRVPTSKAALWLARRSGACGLLPSHGVVSWLVTTLRTVAPRINVKGFSHVCIRVSGMERALDFYGEMLGFEVVFDVELSGPSLEQVTGEPGARGRMVGGLLGGTSIELSRSTARPGPRSRLRVPRSAIRTSRFRWMILRPHARQWRPPAPIPSPGWTSAACGCSSYAIPTARRSRSSNTRTVRPARLSSGADPDHRFQSRAAFLRDALVHVTRGVK